MKKLIIVVDGVESTRYKYNLWRTHAYEDRTVSEDSRVAESDNLDEFLEKVKEVLTKLDTD